MTLIQMIARSTLVLVTLLAGLWGAYEGLAQVADAVGILPVAFVLTIAGTAIVTNAVTRWIESPASPPSPPEP